MGYVDWVRLYADKLWLVWLNEPSIAFIVRGMVCLCREAGTRKAAFSWLFSQYILSVVWVGKADDSST